MLGRELKLGPRSPIVLMAVVLPLLMTLVVAAVFGSLLDPSPRLGVVATTDSAVVERLRSTPGIEVQIVDEDEARRLALDHDVDGVLLLPPGAEDALRSGEPVSARFLVSGQALADSRAVLAAATTAALRDVAGQRSGVEVVVEVAGDEDFIPIGDRVLPLLVVYAVVVAGLFVPAASMLDERIKGTLEALLVTPVRMVEILLAKGGFALVLSVVMGLVTLAINGVLDDAFLPISLVLLVGSLMLVELGLILGLWARDMNTLYTWIKVGGILIVLPGIVALFPGLPQWVAMLAPTYYFLEPINELALFGAELTDVLPTLAVAAAICLVLLPLIAGSSRVAQRRSMAAA